MYICPSIHGTERYLERPSRTHTKIASLSVILNLGNYLRPEYLWGRGSLDTQNIQKLLVHFILFLLSSISSIASQILFIGQRIQAWSGEKQRETERDRERERLGNTKNTLHVLKYCISKIQTF